MSYYELAISTNQITLDEVMTSIKEAFNKKVEFVRWVICCLKRKQIPIKAG